jgi:hypothetical protein
MTFVPPSEDVLEPPQPAVLPQDDHPGFSNEEWAEIQANLDRHYADIYGSDGAGAPPQTGGPAPAPPSSASGQPVATPPAPIAEYDLGPVKIPSEDAGSLAALYTMIRNDPVRGKQILDIVEGRSPTPTAQLPTPSWMPQPPPAPQPVPPAYPSVPVVPPPSFDPSLMDPQSAAMYQRMNELQHSQQQMLDYIRQQQEENERRQQQQDQQTRIARDVELGISRFRRLHPDITEEQLVTIRDRATQLGILPGLLNQFPGDQAVARSFELARLDLGSSLTGAPPAATIPPGVQRQRTLTSLAGGSSGSVPREEPPAPVDTAPDPTLTRAKAAAVEMLKQSGINLADHL